jgi:hypothetical protein
MSLRYDIYFRWQRKDADFVSYFVNGCDWHYLVTYN